MSVWRNAVTLLVTTILAILGLPGLPPGGPPIQPARAQEGPVALDVNPFVGDGTSETLDGTGTQARLRYNASGNPRGGVGISGGVAYLGTWGSIRKVNLSTQAVTTVAGHQTQTGCTDHSDPTQVRFGIIWDVATDGSYVYSTGDCGLSYPIRKTSVTSGATTQLATTANGFKYLTVAPDGWIYATSGSSILKVNPSSGATSTYATLTGATHDITSDSANLWVVRAGSPNAIVRVSLSDPGDQSTLHASAGVGLGALTSAGDHLYGVDSTHRIRRYLKSNGTYATVAGVTASGYANGIGTDAWFNIVAGLGWDGSALLIVDQNNYRLRRGTVTSPLAVVQSELATTDLGINFGLVSTFAGSGQPGNDDGFGEAATLRWPDSVTVEGDTVYVGTWGAIRAVDPETREVTTLAGSATEYSSCVDSTNPGQVRFIGMADIESDGHYLYTLGNCGSNARLRRTNIETGATSTVYDGFMNSITVGPDGLIYALVGLTIQRVDPVEGTLSPFASLPGSPRLITSDATDLWVSYYSGGIRIDRYSLTDGSRSTFAGAGALGDTALESAGAYLYASSGPKIRIYEKATGDWIDIAGSDAAGYADGVGAAVQFSGITGIATDGENLWVADKNNNRLRKLREHIPIEHLLGNCNFGAGDTALTGTGDEWIESWCGEQADPVNSFTGAFRSRVRDASMPGIGMPFGFVRRYNSANDRVGPLGIGWTHSYDYGLTVETGGHVTIRLGDGRRLKFYRQSDGDYWGGPGMRATLEAEGSGYLATTRSGLEYRFSSAGRLTSVSDRNGNDIALTYDGSGNIAQITDTAGRTITLTHNASNRLTKLALPGPREVAYGYTGGLLTSVTDLRGKTWTYQYDAQNRLKKIIDPRANTVIDNTYGTGGRVASQRDPLPNESTFTWDPATETSVMTDARGETWTDVYDGGKLIRRIDPLGNTTRYRYGGRNLKSVTDPRGNKTAFGYDKRGNMTKRTAPAPLSYVETWTYNARNDVTSYTDGRGKTTTFAYDSSGNLSRITAPGSIETIFTRDPAGTGLLTGVTDPRGKTTTFAYDSSGNLISITTPRGHTTTMGYDGSGRMTSAVDPRGNEPGANPAEFTTTSTYDPAGNLLTRTDPLGDTTTLTYDDAGNLATRTDAENHRTTYGYNAANELTSVTAPDLTVTTYGYDQSGNLVSRTDPNNHTTTYEYDDAGRLKEVTNPIGSVWTYTYDPAGNLDTVTDANGNATPAPGEGVTTYSYDQLNRLTRIDFSDATPDAEYSYDGAGNVVEMRDGAGAETYAYDDLGRLTGVIRGSRSFSYQWDGAGNLTRRTYPDGTVVVLGYDDDSRLSSVTSGTQSTSYTRDAAGNVTAVALPNGTTESRVYDRVGRPAEVRHERGQTLLSQFVYAYDRVDNPTSIARTVPPDPTSTTTYRYDSLDRLTEACRSPDCTVPGADVVRFTYDPVGNRLTETTSAGATTYEHDAADRLTSRSGAQGSATYDHDANGSITRAGSRTFSWDLRGLLASTTLGGQTQDHSYDGQGKRLTTSDGSQTTRYLWDVTSGLPELVREENGSGGLIRRYVYGADLVSMTDPSGSFFYHHDALGSVRNLTDSAGLVSRSYDYEPFGTEPAPPPGSPVNPMRFTGEYLDEPTGLYHLRARQYDPALGRFLSTDPLAPALTDPYVSPYVYADSRPTFGVDPSGLRMSSPNKEGCPGWGTALLWGELENAYCEGFLSMSPDHQALFGTMLTLSAEGLLSIGSAKVLSLLVRGLSGTRFARLIAGETGSIGKPFTPNQQALVELAQRAKLAGRTRPISRAEADTLVQWAREYGLLGKTHPPMVHPRPGSSLHINIGPVRHIPVQP